MPPWPPGCWRTPWPRRSRSAGGCKAPSPPRPWMPSIPRAGSAPAGLEHLRPPRSAWWTTSLS
eukprot:296559-Alexandrium_andersonii.AAC.1